MTKKYIHPIPKRILQRIKKTDAEVYPAQNGHIRFYAYLAVWRNELVKVTIAVKNYHKKWYCKQVALHSVHSDYCLVKDLEYCGYTGYGYRVGWYEEGLKKYPQFYEQGWCTANNKYYDPYAMLINREVITKLPQYKYSAYMQYSGKDIIRYLRNYEKYPQAEYLVKSGMHYLADSVVILRKIQNDKVFRKWLIKHKTEIADSYYYICTVLQAYKTGRSLNEQQAYESRKKKFIRSEEYAALKDLFSGNMLEKFFKYLDSQDISFRIYSDYATTCNYLGINMSENKNLFPHDFKRWHDIRIDQYATAKAEADERQSKELYSEFKRVAEKYQSLQKTDAGNFAVVIAKSPAELIHEGNVLQHCVGKMGYDRKFIREETLIFFVRNINELNTPFVTLEYSIQRKQILQSYGLCNNKPEKDVLNFINTVWLPHANKVIRKICA